MITAFILLLITYLLRIFSFLLPDWTISTDFTSAFGSGLQSALSLNGILPIYALLVVISSILAFELLIILTRIVSSLISLFRGGGVVDL